MNTKQTPPFPAKGQSILAPRFEAWVHVCLWVAVVGAALSLLALAIYKFDANEKARAREQHRLEQKAIEDGHAIETRP